MNWFTGVIVYVLIWWVVLFTVLPWRNQPPKNPQTGTAASAPNKPNLGIKFVATTVISAFVWVVVYLMIDQGIIDYRAIAIQMMREDHAQ